MKKTKNVQTVLGIFQDEVNGDVASALKKMTKDYTMTWVYLGKNLELFPTTVGKIIKKEMEDVYPIKGRWYEIKNIAEGKDVVMVELVESYPNPKTKKTYRTPLVLALEIKNGKIRIGRHYLDPTISKKCLTKRQVNKAYKNSSGQPIVIK